MGDKTEKTYEMLWDCEYCGTKKLLGKTHRHCPECGAVQNPEKRYFPPDDEKIAVEDHQFVGADRHCTACNAPNSAAAEHCTECGALMDGSAEVRAAVDAPKPPPAPTPAPVKSKKRIVWVIAASVLLIAGICVLLLWKRETALTVTGRTWERAVGVERFSALPQSEWCTGMPTDAYDISRSREVRSYNKVPDGETCRTKRVDNRDGTFSEHQECTPKYRKEPVYDDKCRFMVNRWTETRRVKASGASLAEPPTWPAVNLPPNAVNVLGAERQGRRYEQYTVSFTGKPDEKYTCDFPEAVWRTYGDDTQWKGEVGMLTSVLDCASLKAK